jgi:hypothetical protein
MYDLQILKHFKTLQGIQAGLFEIVVAGENIDYCCITAYTFAKDTRRTIRRGTTEL